MPTPVSNFDLRMHLACLFLLMSSTFIPPSGFGQQSQKGTAQAPKFDQDVAPIFLRSCVGCHSGSTHKGGLVLEGYDSLMKGGRHGPVIRAGDPDASRLLQMIEGKLDPQMPLESDPLKPADISTIRSWIKSGAPAPSSSAAAMTAATEALPPITTEVPVLSPITSVRFSPDGKFLAVGGYKQVRIIDTMSNRPTGELAGHADAVRSLAFSPDGRMLAAGGGEPQREGEIRIWDLESHRLVHVLKGHRDCIYSVAWSPDGKQIASSSYDKMVKLWDPATGKELANLQDHIDAVFAVAYSPDGKRLASASQDRTVKIWDISTGKRLYTLSDASDGLTSLAYSPSGDKLAAAGYDKTIYIWQLGDMDGHLLHSLIADEDSQLSIAWSRDGGTIITASADGSIRFRDVNLDLKGVVDRQPDWVESLDVSPDSKWVAAGRYNGSLTIYNASTFKEVLSLSVFHTAGLTGISKTEGGASR